MTDFVMPDGIYWVRSGVLKCERCKVEENVTGFMGLRGPEFFRNHRTCTTNPDPGVRPASQMTIREAFAVRLMAASVARWTPLDTKTTSEEAVSLADALVKALRPIPEELDFDILVDAPTPEVAS